MQYANQFCNKYLFHFTSRFMASERLINKQHEIIDERMLDCKRCLTKLTTNRCYEILKFIFDNQKYKKMK